MNINQYMCNMKVLAGLVIANSIELYIDLDYNAKNVTDTIDISDETNQLVNFYLTIYPGHTNINTYIIYNDGYMYLQAFGLGGRLRVFLQ